MLIFRKLCLKELLKILKKKEQGIAGIGTVIIVLQLKESLIADKLKEKLPTIN